MEIYSFDIGRRRHWNVVSVDIDRIPTTDDPAGFGFVILGKDRMWKFRARTDRERQQWVEMMRSVVLLKDVEAQTERRRFILFCVGLVECLCYFDCFDLETPFPLRLRSLDREWTNNKKEALSKQHAKNSNKV